MLLENIYTSSVITKSDMTLKQFKPFCQVTVLLNILMLQRPFLEQDWIMFFRVLIDFTGYIQNEFIKNNQTIYRRT